MDRKKRKKTQTGETKKQITQVTLEGVFGKFTWDLPDLAVETLNQEGFPREVAKACTENLGRIIGKFMLLLSATCCGIMPSTHSASLSIVAERMIEGLSAAFREIMEGDQMYKKAGYERRVREGDAVEVAKEIARKSSSWKN